MSARFPLGYVAPAVGSQAMIPSDLSDGWLQVTVLEVRPHVGSRMPEIVGAPHGSQLATFRSAEWRALGATDIRCGTCYRVVPAGETIESHALTSAQHRSVARILERAS